jgi:hypothetical protein
MKRNYYAWNWTRGVCTDMESGHPIGHLHVFSSQPARQSWIAEAAHLPRSNPGFREAVPAWWTRYDADPVIHVPGGKVQS